jgi:hypothetical protein
MRPGVGPMPGGTKGAGMTSPPVPTAVALTHLGRTITSEDVRRLEDDDQ